MEQTYAIGQKVECRDVNDPSLWRPATIRQFAAYRGREGYYIAWTDIDWAGNPPGAGTPSSGGWTYLACMRPVTP